MRDLEVPKNAGYTKDYSMACAMFIMRDNEEDKKASNNYSSESTTKSWAALAGFCERPMLEQ